jgi:hypothetical protein
MLIEHGDDNMIRITYYGLVDNTQGYEIVALYTHAFRLLLFYINQLESVRSTATFGIGNYVMSLPESPITTTGHCVNHLYFISPTASAHTPSTRDGLTSTPLITVPITLSRNDSSTHPTQCLNTLTASTITMPTPRE